MNTELHLPEENHEFIESLLRRMYEKAFVAYIGWSFHSGLCK
jgi:hypothetical protein